MFLDIEERLYSPLMGLGGVCDGLSTPRQRNAKGFVVFQTFLCLESIHTYLGC